MGKRWTIKDLEQATKSGKPGELPTPKANDLTKAALRMLNLLGYEAWRQNNGGVYDPKLKRFRANSSTPGISDILGFDRKTGRFLACEIKAGRDQLSDEQDRFLERVRNAGGIAIVIRTNDDVTNLKNLKC